MKKLIDANNSKVVGYLNYKYNILKDNPLFFYLHPKVALFLVLRFVFIFLRLITGGYNHYFKDKTILKPGGLIDLILYRRTYKHTQIDLKLFLLPKKVQDIENIPLSFVNCFNPVVSVIIPVYNKWQYTFNCIRSLKENTMLPEIEVIIVDDNSSDETEVVFSGIKGIKYLKNDENIGFIRSCNKGAAAAAGRYICFLNNDTQVLPGWIENLLSVFNTEQNVGLVGSKFIYPDGRLQEAGGIIWQDGSGYNYGRLKSPVDPDFNYLRDVDYCSGACIVLEKELFSSLNGFDERFVPAYYEDTDLCFQIRELGKRVLYQPKSEVVHFEGVTSGTSLSSGTKRYQLVNKEKFVNKWAKVLQEKHFPPLDHSEVYLGAIRIVSDNIILVVDSYVPRYDRESGSNRLLQLVRMMKELGYHVIYAPDNGYAEEPYASLLQNMGVELLYNYDNVHIGELIERLTPFIKTAWVCRPELNNKYQEILRKNRELRIIYDTIDLHYLRLKREKEISPELYDKSALAWEEMRQVELKMAAMADLVITVTNKEKEILLSEVECEVEVIPNIHTSKLLSSDFESRDGGLIFIGSYDHLPNRDAVLWLIQEIMPLVWTKFPDLKITLLGNNPPENIVNLANDRISVPGFVADVSGYFESALAFVCPLRYGAGMKGKIGQSLEFNLPIISTTIGVEGMGMNHEEHYLRGDTTNEFADSIVKLITDKTLWKRLSANSKVCLYPYSYDRIKTRMHAILENVCSEEKVIN